MVIVILVGLAIVGFGAGTFLTPGAPQPMREVSAFIVANACVLGGYLLLRQF